MLSIEFSTCDARLDVRAQSCLEQISEHPDKNFPQLFKKTADLEGFYRLMNNPRLSHEELIASISADTFKRLPEREEILMIHDTTLIEPEFKAQEEQGFGRLRGQKHIGFLAHVSLAVSLGAKPVIYGLTSGHLWTRKKSVKSKKRKPAVESKRWGEQIASIERFNRDRNFIHVADREGDSYALFSELIENKNRFVIRLAQDRNLAEQKLFAKMRELPSVEERQVQIFKREQSLGLKQKTIHPSRDARESTLCISAQRLDIPCSDPLMRRKDKQFPKSLSLNVVRVFEKSPPNNAKPIEWFLITTEDITSVSSIWRVVDIYRRRWTIEEFFKALKTGCRLESRLFTSLGSWEKMLSLYLPVAATLVNLKYLDFLQAEPTEPFAIFSETQWQILTILAKKRGKILVSMADAKNELAQLGGYLKRSTSPPGWQILARAYEDLLEMEVGWNLHRDM